MFFWGIPHLNKGYKCLSPIGKLFISKDVVFNEVKFPYSDLFLSSSKSDLPPINPISFIPSIPIVPQSISSLSLYSNSVATPTSVDPTADSNSNYSPSVNADSSPAIASEIPSPIFEAGSTSVQDNSAQSSDLSPSEVLTVQQWSMFLQLIPLLCRPDQGLEFIYQDLIQPCYLLTVNPNL